MSLLVTVQGKVINGRFMSEVQPGMLMLLREGGQRGCSHGACVLMDTVRPTTLVSPRLRDFVLTTQRHGSAVEQ